MLAGQLLEAFPRSKAKRARLAIAVFLAVGLSGCSLDASNVDVFGIFDEGPPAAETAGQASVRERGDQASTEAELEATPALSSVPPRPAGVTPPDVRQRVVEGLVADRANARYSDQTVRLQGTSREISTAAPGATTAPPPPPVTSTADRSDVAPTAQPTPVIPREPLPAPEPVQLATGPRPEVQVDPTAIDGGSAFPLTASRVTIDDQVATIHFAHSSSKLDDRDRAVIAQVASAQKQTGAEVVVVGHASGRTQQLNKVEHELANFRISLARANRVAEQLIAMGVPSEKVTIEARADDNRLYAESMPTGEAGNRRAEIYFRQ